MVHLRLRKLVQGNTIITKSSSEVTEGIWIWLFYFGEVQNTVRVMALCTSIQIMSLSGFAVTIWLYLALQRSESMIVEVNVELYLWWVFYGGHLLRVQIA
jgi:hypothetical protein